MDNLNDSDYLKSNECAAAEEFVMAFKVSCSVVCICVKYFEY